VLSVSPIQLGAPSCANGGPNRGTLLEAHHRLLERPYGGTGRPFADIRQAVTSLLEVAMTQVSVRCFTTRGGVLDGRVANVDDLIDAYDYATRVARSLIAIPSSRDFRECYLSVIDDLGDELFWIPFPSIIGKPH
jgi:hypothetical protein